jgi:hypothetical protein
MKEEGIMSLSKASMVLILVVSVSVAFAAQPPAEEGALVIFREKSIVGAAAKPLIRLNGEPLLELRNGIVWMGRLPAGGYRLSAHDSDYFSSHDADVSAIEVTLAPGETVYVRARLAMGVRKPDTTLSPVSAEEGERASGRLAVARPKDIKEGALLPFATATAAEATIEAEQQRLYLQKAKADIRSIATAAEAYAIDHDRYPLATDLDSLRPELQPVYIRELPMTDPWGRPYRWLSDGVSYRVVSGGADGSVAPGVMNLGAAAPGAADDIIFENGEFVGEGAELP